MGITHLSFKFRARHQCSHRVYDQHIDRAGAHQRIGNFQSLLARIRLRDQEFVNIHTQFLRITGVQRVFGIDDGAGAAHFLGFGDYLERQRGFTRAFWSINFSNAPAQNRAKKGEENMSVTALKTNDRTGDSMKSQASPDKQKALDAALGQIERAFGKGSNNLLPR